MQVLRVVVNVSVWKFFVTLAKRIISRAENYRYPLHNVLPL